MMLISVVIPAYNEGEILRQTLEKIRYAIAENEGEGISWEIIVCDNNSGDETAAIAQTSGATVVFEPINQISHARNTGAAAAKGDWLLYKNPVITSGRKGKMGVLSLGRLFISNFLAVILFILHYLLPKAAVRWLGSRLLGYWYNQRL